MQSFYDRVVDIISASGINEFTVIYNGSYYMQKSKLTYLKLSKSSRLVFYTKEKRDLDSAIIENPIDALSDLKHMMSSYSLFGQDIDAKLVDAGFDLINLAEVSINEGLQFIIIESPLYSIARQAVTKSLVNVSIETEAFTIDPITLNRMKSIFEINSYISYKKFLNIRNSRKIIHRFLNKNKFYSIQRAFIPMFIQINGIYNPLLDNPSATAVKNSDIYKTAIEKGRLLDINGYMQAYMMTHLEICQSFHLTNFMRFTPLFAYEVLVGLILPGSSHFPSNTNVVLLAPNAAAAKDYDLKNYYAPDEFTELVKSLQQQLEVATRENSADTSSLTETLNFLTSYTKGNTMKLYVEKELASLIAFANLPFDERVTADSLSTYLLSARLN